MSGWAWAWLVGALYLAAVEVLAYRSGNYWHTLTGTVVRIMLAHPLVAVVVLGALCAVVWHLALDYALFRPKVGA